MELLAQDLSTGNWAPEVLQHVTGSRLPDTYVYVLIYSQTLLMLLTLDMNISHVFRGLRAHHVCLIRSNSAPPGHLQFG